MITFMMAFWLFLCTIYFMVDPKIALPTFIFHASIFQFVTLPLINADEKANILKGKAF